MKLILTTLLLINWTSTLVAKVPRAVIPKSIKDDLRELDKKFSTTLQKECENKCYSKGCTYGNHKVVREKDSSLPGLNFDNRLTRSLDYQYYLTKAECSYAFETIVSDAEIAQLNQRLKTKLSNANLKLSIKSKKLFEAIEQ